MTCPYCGNTDATRFSEPVPVCQNLPPGIVVPLIQQCLACQATLNPEAFEPGSERFAHALIARKGANAPLAASVAA
jgi:hypothetical protein